MSADSEAGRPVAILGRFLTTRTPLDWPILVLILMIPVSLWATFDVRFSLPKVIGLLVGVAAFYATVTYASDRERLGQAVAVFFSLGALIAALGLIGTNWLYKSPLLSDIVRRLPQLIRGLPGAPQGFHPNEVAGVLVWFVPAQIVWSGWQWHEGQLRTRGGVLVILSTLLTTATLILTQSRSGWLGLAAGLAVIGACVDKRIRAGLGLGLIGGLVILLLKGPSWVGATLFGGTTLEVVGSLNWSFRMQLWQAALWGIRDFAFTGMGLGTFRRVARLLYPLAVPPAYDIAHAHNGFLQAGVDLGVPGLVAYTGIWLLAGRLVLASLRRADGWLRALAIGLGACMMGSLMYNLTDTVALGARPGPAWWMMLGLVVSAYRLLTGGEDKSPQGQEIRHERDN